MQTDATLLANNTQHCWAQHVASVRMESQQCWQLLAVVTYSLNPVKLLGPYKRTQHCWPKTPNNTQQCCDLFRPFAWALRYSLGKRGGGGGGRGGGRLEELTFKILKAFLFYYCTRSANINQNCNSRGEVFCLQMYFYCPSTTMPGFGSMFRR